jgi:hypothetical protein
MKKITALWMMILMLVISAPAMGMSMSKVRENARFLTDRMAYELNLTPMQYDDVYEVNFDFIDNVRHIMDDVVRGHGHAVDRYYDFLNYRNDDLRWILSASQYRRFMGVEYFYRPIYTTASTWLFRIYKVYHDVKHFYFGKPHHYKSYKGGHYRIHHGNVSYYKNHRKDHYKHDFYKGDVRLHHDKRNAPPKANSRPAPDRKKEVKPSAPKRNQEVRRPSNIQKESRPNRRQELKTDAKKENSRRNSGNSRGLKRENQDVRRGKR